MSDNHQAMLHTADTISFAAIAAAFMGVLSPLAALVALVWYAIQIYESKTFQSWWHRQRKVKHKRKHPHDDA